jgi:Mg2+ and Co2+ transporter CorA
MTAQINRLQDELASSAATKADMQKAIAAVREEMQTATRSLAEDVAAARKFLLQTAQLGWLNHELNTENANGIRKVSTASQELVSNSARLADTIRQLSDNLASQLKQLAERLDGIQNKINAIK